MKQIIGVLNIKVEPNYTYFIDDNGNICRFKDIGDSGKKSHVEIVKKTKIEKEEEFAYFIDNKSRICCVYLGKISKNKKVFSKKQK